MAEQHRIKIEPLNEEAFAPFGEILTTKSRPPDIRGIGSEGWLIDFHTNGRPQVLAAYTRYEPLRFNRLERHLNVTQTFIPVGGSPTVVALAPPPPDPNDWGAIPKPEDVRAFFIGSTAYVLKKGTWHSLDRYPLYPPGANFVIFTDYETSDELGNKPKDDWRLTQDVDYEANFGVVFELVL